MTTIITYAFQEPASSALMDAFDRAAIAIEAVCDVDLVLAQGPADITVIPASTYGPGAALIGLPSTIWIDPALEQSWGFGRGTYGWLVALHELNHSLGLGHRFDRDMADSAQSYTYVYARDGHVLNPETPMPLDIEDLIAIYGPNLETAADATRHLVDRPDQLATYYDAGGAHDLLDLSGLVGGCLVDLGHATVDTGSGILRTVGIEDVCLGVGADTVILAAGERVYNLTKADLLIADDDTIHKLTGREKRAEGLSGRWFEVNSAYVEFHGSARALDKLVMES